MVDRAFEFAPQRARVLGGDAGDEHVRFAFQKVAGNFQDLFGCFARSEHHFREPFSQRPMRVHLRKPQIGHGRRLEFPHHIIAADTARAKFFQQFDRFNDGHAPIIITPADRSRQIWRSGTLQPPISGCA